MLAALQTWASSVAGDSLFASEQRFEAQSFDPFLALGHLDGQRRGSCPLPAATVQPIGEVAAIGLGPQHLDLVLRILAKGQGLRLIGLEVARLRSLLRRIALEQEYALWIAACALRDADPASDPPMSLEEIRLVYLTELLNFVRNLLRQGRIIQLDTLDLVAGHALGQPPESGGPIYQARCHNICAPQPVTTA